ncbi:hydroxyethylthiazole kinase [Clostridium lacusfryxellense]|uniref:hydroxyethylthiazole kinase n=1 Tax=Clostridium lacusfryxellense TaxID=205328 RepID=UPI001C0DF274|nr:hydroxyethylthiazole kinase [Clostridium lacusfryxellense]MBU3112170.1 hydroxyethylthiazole kinase [Clostridium lacusfryxellense]
MEINKKIVELLKNVKEKNPLVHHITNYVTVNDCANITLAIGASPVMADDINEVSDMVSLSSSLVINIGTLNSRSVESMIMAGKRANELNIPVILDPVGVGATNYRTVTAKRIISEVKLAVIRGNLSEVKVLYGTQTKTKGVDSIEIDSENVDEFAQEKEMASALAIRLNTVVAITGARDVISDGKTIYSVANGHKIMSKVTGTGCMCTSLIGSYLGAGDNNLIAAVAGIVSMGIAGEVAYSGLDKNIDGTGTLKVKILDIIYNLSENLIMKRSKINEE